MTSEKTKKKFYFKKLLQRRVKVNVISLRGVFLARLFFMGNGFFWQIKDSRQNIQISKPAKFSSKLESIFFLTSSFDIVHEMK